jgi:chromosome segregation ATPase
MRDFKIVLIAFLLGASIFSAAKYAMTLREKHLLQVNLEEKKGEISVLQNEKQGLLQEVGKEKELNQRLAQKNALLKDNLKAGRDRLAHLFVEYDRAQEGVERLNSEVAILKAENAAVRAEGDKLKLELAQAGQENEKLNGRLNSVAELKKAIHELRTKKNSPSVEIKKIEVKKKPTTETELTGNRGYIIKDGVPFPGVSSVKVTIEVSPDRQQGLSAGQAGPDTVNPAQNNSQ